MIKEHFNFNNDTDIMTKIMLLFTFIKYITNTTNNIIDFQKFIDINNINPNSIIKISEKYTDLLDSFKHSFKRINKSNISIEDGEKIFIAFIDYCCYLDLQTRKTNNSFIGPSNNSFNYSTPNDIKPTINKYYIADLLLNKT